LELSDLQTLDAVALDRVMPRKELFDGQEVAAANLLDCDLAGMYCFDDRGFAPHGPPLGVGRSQFDCRGISPRQTPNLQSVSDKVLLPTWPVHVRQLI